MPIIVTPVFTPSVQPPVLVSTTVSETPSSGTTLPVSLPTRQSGDLLIIIAFPYGAINGTPSGWTSRSTFDGTNTGGTSVGVFTRIATGSESNTVTINTKSQAEYHMAYTLLVRGGVFSNAATTGGSGNPANMTVPAITTTANGSLVICGLGTYTNDTTTPHTWTGITKLSERFSSGGDSSGFYNHDTLASDVWDAGSVGPFSVATQTAGSYGAASVSIAPAA